MKIWDNLQPNYLENLKKETLRKSLVKEFIFNSERVIGDIRCWVNEVKISCSWFFRFVKKYSDPMHETIKTVWYLQTLE